MNISKAGTALFQLGTHSRTDSMQNHFRNSNFGAWILAILLFPVEVVSTSARLLSLTVRLWANMFASDLIYLIFLGLLAGGAGFGWSKSVVLGVILGIFPATIPVLFIGLHLFVSVVQAYVFTVLPSVYLGLAISEEH